MALRSYGWVQATSGRLTDAERAAVRAAIRRSYTDIAKGVVTWPLRRRGTPSIPQAPDSALVRHAVEAAAEQGPALLGHGYRTWILGSVLASVDRVAVDPELLYVVSLLHDSGMTRQVVGTDFTLRSAEAVLDVFARAAQPPARGAAAADAVVAHATPGLAVADDPIGFYVQAGAMADLAGLRMWDLPRGQLAAAYRDHPAHDVHRVIAALIRREADDVPDGRFALLKRAGMATMVTLSPTRRHGRTHRS